jgi:hypothetical protein
VTHNVIRAQGSVACWGIMLQVAVSVLDEVVGFYNWPNPSSHSMAPGSTQTLTNVSTINLPGGKGWPAHKANNLTTICESIV